MSARVLFSTGSLYLYDTSYAFALAAEAGFDGIEIMCDDRWSTRDPGYLKDMSALHHLPILAAHTPFSPKIPGWGYAHDEINRITQTISLAETLGCEVVIVHVPPRVRSKTIQIASLEIRLPVAAADNKVKLWIENQLPNVQRKSKVKIALENMPRKEIPGFDGDPYWWNQVDTWSRAHDYLTMDTTHWGTFKIDPLIAYQAAGKRIVHVHLSNFHKNEEHHLPQKGELKLGVLLDHMAADGFDGTVSLEVNPQNLEYKDVKAVRHKLKETVKFMRRHLEPHPPTPSINGDEE